MTRVFHLASDLGPNAAAKQLSLVVPALPADRFAQAVGVLGSGQPFGGPVAAAGIDLVRLPLRHAIDANGLLAVARTVRTFRPDVVHAWGPLAARASALLSLPRVGLTPAPPVVVSGCTGAEPGSAGWFTRRVLKRAAAVTATSVAEADRVRTAAGVVATRIPPAVGPTPTPPDRSAFRQSLAIPEDARIVMAAGRFEIASGMKTAAWAFDVLKYTAPDLFLVLVGDGPDRERVARFSRAIGFDDNRVRFAGSRPDAAALVGLADVAWVTHARGGVNFALEAMAAGVVVIALHNPDLAEVIRDGATGRLVPAGDRVRLAAVTDDLLGDPSARERLRAAGRAEAETRFAVGPVVERFAAVYHDVTKAGR
jgi:glycosyltransferase involved in cell wall biosynthesis